MDQPTDETTDHQRTGRREVDLGPFARLIGLEALEVDGDHVLLAWEAAGHLHQPHGVVHGGVHCAVVETAASVGAALWWGGRGAVVGVANSTDFLRAVRSGRLISLAVPLHRGRSQQLWEVRTSDAEERLVARGQVRLQNLPGEPGR